MEFYRWLENIAKMIRRQGIPAGRIRATENPPALFVKRGKQGIVPIELGKENGSARPFLVPGELIRRAGLILWERHLAAMSSRLEAAPTKDTAAAITP